MGAILTTKSAVLVAHDVNMSIFKPHWLVENGVLRPDDFGDTFMMSPMVVQVPTANFDLAVFPNRIQQAIRPDFDDAGASLQAVMGRIVALLPHTPYTALGLNFDYFVPFADEAAIPAWTRKRFTSPFTLGILPEAAEDARFGAYVSYDVPGFRLKVTCLPKRFEQVVLRVAAVPMVAVAAQGGDEGPAISPGPKVGDHVVHISYNFHTDLGEQDRVRQICDKLAKWDEAASLAQRITDQLTS